MTFRTIVLAASALALSLGVTAEAQTKASAGHGAGLEPGMGAVELSFGGSNAVNGTASSELSGGYISGMYSFAMGENIGVVDVMLGRDIVTSGPILSPTTMPDISGQIGLHSLRPFGDGGTVGWFLGFASAPHGGNPNLLYQVIMAGAQMTRTINERTTLFGQVGYGTVPGDRTATASAGFYDGVILRGGATYSVGNTVLTLDMEIARTTQYEDPSEPGNMWTVGLSGETPIGMDGNLALTYGIRYGWFDALSDPDEVGETSINVGLRYLFGGNSKQRMVSAGYIGLPYLPLRGSMWTPEMD